MWPYRVNRADLFEMDTYGPIVWECLALSVFDDARSQKSNICVFAEFRMTSLCDAGVTLDC